MGWALRSLSGRTSLGACRHLRERDQGPCARAEPRIAPKTIRPMRAASTGDHRRVTTCFTLAMDDDEEFAPTAAFVAMCSLILS